MSRPIEFRAWGTDGLNGGKKSLHYFGLDEAYHYTCGEMMQYTGLKDKNGKKIFEGDIMSDYSVIEYYSEDLITNWHVFMGFSVPNDREVIGNIHQNPELLKPTKDS